MPLSGKPLGGIYGGGAVTQLERNANSNQVMPSTDILVERRTTGTFLKLRNPMAGAGDSVVPFYIHELQDIPVAQSGTVTRDSGTYINAQKGGEGGSVEKVLLPQYCRNYWRPSSESYIRPAYEVGDIIYCVKVSSSGSPNAESFIDLNVDARRWCVAVSYCQNDVTNRYWIPAVE